MSQHTEKVRCPDCGEVIKVPAGKDLADLHSHREAPVAQTRTRTSSSARSQTIKEN